MGCDEANALFTQSSAFCHRLGAKFYAVCSDLSWEKMLAERQVPADIEKARGLLTKPHIAEATRVLGRWSAARPTSPRVDCLVNEPLAPDRLLAEACSLPPKNQRRRRIWSLSIEP